MARILRETLLQIREISLTWGPFILVGIAALLGAYFLANPTPPKRVTMATGVAQGAYSEFGQRYAQRLKRHGIHVELRNTQGAAENLALLRDASSGVDLAFVQGGAAEPSADEHLVSLGSMFHEPVWLFYRADSARRLLRKELGVALANGLIWGGVIGFVAWLLYRNVALGFVMTAAMTLNLLLAALMGVLIPMTLLRLGRDPAMGSSVMITALTDSGGFFIFLGLATLFLI